MPQSILLYIVLFCFSVNGEVQHVVEDFPLVLRSVGDDDLQISACPLEVSPQKLITNERKFTIFLSNEFESQLTKKCSNSSIGFYVYHSSPIDIAVEPLDLANDTKSLIAPVNIPFNAEKNQYLTFHVEVQPVEMGLELELVLEDGDSAQLFFSSCIDHEGVLVGEAKYLSSLLVSYDATKIVELIDQTACAGHGALYTDLELNAQIIFRIRSKRASGVLILKRNVNLEKAEAAALSTRSVISHLLLADRNIKLEENETASIDAEIGDELKFRVISGQVQLSYLNCEEVEDVACYIEGYHRVTIAPNTTCNSTTLTVVFTALEPSEFILDTSNPSKLLIVGAAIVFLIVVAFIFYVLHVACCTHKEKLEISRRECFPNGINHVKMESAWM